jgi:hypothetical protein
MRTIRRWEARGQGVRTFCADVAARKSYGFPPLSWIATVVVDTLARRTDRGSMN